MKGGSLHYCLMTGKTRAEKDSPPQPKKLFLSKYITTEVNLYLNM